MSFPATQTGRADLLRMLAVREDAQLSVAAPLVGYYISSKQSSDCRPDEKKAAQPDGGEKSAKISADAAEVISLIEPAQSEGQSGKEQFWHLHKRKKLRIGLNHRREQRTPPELRNVRPLRARELHLPDIESARTLPSPLKSLGRKKTPTSIARQVKAAARLQPMNRPQLHYYSEIFRNFEKKVHPHVRRLLGLLSPAEQVDLQLLQTLIRLLPSSVAECGVENAVRVHPDVRLNQDKTLSLALRPEKRSEYLLVFKKEDAVLREKVFILLHRHHSRRFPALFALELIRAEQLLRIPQRKFRYNRLEHFMLRLVRTWLEQPKNNQIIRYAKAVLRLLPKSICIQYTWPSFLYGIAYRNRLRTGTVIPQIYKPEAVIRIVRKVTLLTGYLLVQEGENIFLVKGPDVGVCLLKGSRIAYLELSDDVLLFSKKNRIETVPVQTEMPICSLAGVKIFYIRTSNEILDIKAYTRPVWAHLIGRNSRELFVEIPWLGRNYRLYWQLPESGEKGQWKSYHGPVGVDRIGLYADIGMEGTLVQRFRWINPGSFLMGSPGDEPEREGWGRETLHEVTLTEGFWLADTAVTQELWQIVTGENPARFREDRHPVENVNREDIQNFLTRLNRIIPGLSARLPTEAEWEYACRAGTETPFSFGGKITPDQVNYNGTYPYNKGRKGKNRCRTVAVKSLPCNGWGLYEMHGNIWEWCQDYWQDDLTPEPAVDPCGPKHGDFCMVRGGSWFLNGRSVRSAIRGRFAPEFRNERIGFRLARSHAPGMGTSLLSDNGSEPPEVSEERLLQIVK